MWVKTGYFAQSYYILIVECVIVEICGKMLTGAYTQVKTNARCARVCGLQEDGRARMAYQSGISNTAFVKNHYYPGKLLCASDFLREQEYGNGKLEFINRKFHGCGIVEGLEVRPGEDGILYISEGSAIDLRGRILIVPRETAVNVRRLEGLPATPGQDFILGIRYAERTSEEEASYLEPGKPYRGAKIEEAFALRAYTWDEWRNLRIYDGGVKPLTEERLLYQDENVSLVVMTPRAVPSDSIFKCRIQARVRHGENASIGWQCTARLQGAFFAESGKHVRQLEGEETVFSGSVMREWEICTEENRRLPVTLELMHLKVRSGDSDIKEPGTFQLQIGTASSYEDIVRKYQGQRENAECEKAAHGQIVHNEPECGEKAAEALADEGLTREADWIPLAYIKASGSGANDGYAVSGDQDVRFMAFCPVREQAYRLEAERNGIVDIRWRGLLKALLPQPSFPPYEPQPSPPLPQPGPDPLPLPVQPGLSREQVQELAREQIEEKREQCIRRGIAVIPVPRHYRRGRTLFSEEIAHGFPGEEVFLWCGRVLEGKNYAYWSRDKMRYFVLNGAEGLFPDSGDSGWKIDKQAVKQNVEEGTFQIALTLSKGRRRGRDREVAISWIAVKTI